MRSIFQTIKTRTAVALWLAAAILAGCADEEEESRPAGLPYHADYRISGEEGAEVATGLMRFLEGGAEGRPVVLPAGTTLTLDGSPLTADSAGITGAYYEFQRPLRGFEGLHRVSLQPSTGPAVTDSFRFYAFRLAEELPQVLSRSDWDLPLQGLPNGATVRVILTDTSFTSTDINELEEVRGGRLRISRQQLDNVVNGPLTLQLIWEEERPLAGGSGLLSLSYSLMRELELGE